MKLKRSNNPARQALKRKTNKPFSAQSQRVCGKEFITSILNTVLSIIAIIYAGISYNSSIAQDEINTKRSHSLFTISA